MSFYSLLTKNIMFPTLVAELLDVLTAKFKKLLDKPEQAKKCVDDAIPLLRDWFMKMLPAGTGTFADDGIVTTTFSLAYIAFMEPLGEACRKETDDPDKSFPERHSLHPFVYERFVKLGEEIDAELVKRKSTYKFSKELCLFELTPKAMICDFLSLHKDAPDFPSKEFDTVLPSDMMEALDKVYPVDPSVEDLHIRMHCN